MTEIQIQSSCVTWFWNTYPKLRGLFFSVNNNSEHVVRAMNRKAAGQVAGVSDTIFLYAGNVYLIEFKTDTGRQSLARKNWEQLVTNEGFDYIIIRSLSDFQRLIKKIVKT